MLVFTKQAEYFDICSDIDLRRLLYPYEEVFEILVIFSSLYFIEINIGDIELSNNLFLLISHLKPPSFQFISGNYLCGLQPTSADKCPPEDILISENT